MAGETNTPARPVGPAWDEDLDAMHAERWDALDRAEDKSAPHLLAARPAILSSPSGGRQQNADEIRTASILYGGPRERVEIVG